MAKPHTSQNIDFSNFFFTLRFTYSSDQVGSFCFNPQRIRFLSIASLRMCCSFLFSSSSTLHFTTLHLNDCFLSVTGIKGDTPIGESPKKTGGQ